MIRPAIAGLALAALSATAQAQDAATIQPNSWPTPIADTLPEPADYFCAVAEYRDFEDGEPTFDAETDQKLRRPSRTRIPLTGEEGLIAEAMHQDGQSYAYLKIRGEGLGTYAVHGVFYFDSMRMVTTRSAIFPTNESDWLASAATYTWLCDPAADPGTGSAED